ncbi:FxsA family protein [Nocardioides perillae]|uniref:UPF0716 protein FxsA n=1 Tax=Nocardioides perillae TaxID=1119534 RepID=A0A7Y9RSM8_9ACTN|nr:UPF0716 protein FxsA [Nocardioides perillae]
MSHPAAPRRRRPVTAVLVAAFLVVPLLEVYLLVQVGQVIGAWWTLALLVLSGVVGGWLVKREGARAWRGLTTALSSGRAPARELADGALVLVGGTLMLTPGFASDAVGIVLLLPVTRPVARRALTAVVARRLLGPGPFGGGPLGGGAGAGGPFAGGPFGAGPDARRPGDRSGEQVVRGEVVEE